MTTQTERGQNQQQHSNFNQGFSAQQLVQEAHNIWQNTQDSLSDNLREDFSTTLQELSNRTMYICNGQPPQPTKYSSLEGSALAQHAYGVVRQIAKVIPANDKGQLGIVHELADRVETVAVGSSTSGSSGGRGSSMQGGGNTPQFR